MVRIVCITTEKVLIDGKGSCIVSLSDVVVSTPK